MRHNPTPYPPEETPRQRPDEHVQRDARAAPQLLLRERRDVEVRHDVPQEIGERARREEQEESIAYGGRVEEGTALARAREHRGAREQRGEGEQRARERDEAEGAHRPGEARAVDQAVEHDDVDHAACTH